MPRTCTICDSDSKDIINHALVEGRSSYRAIAGQYGFSKSSLQRHKEEHIPADLIKAKQAAETCRADSLINKIIRLKSDAERITEKAESNGDLKIALSGIREQSRIIEILAKMQGQIQQPQIDLTVNNFALLKIHDRLSRKVEEINEPNG